jgi:hypothetical protein
MTTVHNTKELLAAAQKQKRRAIIYDEASTIDTIGNERDKFELSFGNLDVLRTIPDMMIEPSWRKKLRNLVLDYHIERGFIK